MNSTRSYRLPPQMGQPSNTTAMMGDVLVALIPALMMAVFFFGLRVLVLTAISVGACVGFERLYRRLTHQSDTTRDLSACVTGMLLAMSLPATSSYFVPVLGAAFAIVLVKQFYGGLGKNFMNPALTGRMLLATFPMLMTRWSLPLNRLPLFSLDAVTAATAEGVDAVTAATPLAYLSAGQLPPQTMRQLLLGATGGCMGEVSAFMLMLGGLYLILRKVISPRIPLAFLGTAAVLTLISAPKGVSPLLWMGSHLLSGGLMLGAFFLATDPTTSPVTPRGQTLFGCGCGVLTVLLRYFSSYPEGVGWAILTMNCCVWLLDRAGMPRRFGDRRFSAVRALADDIRRSAAKVRFVKPSLPILRRSEGKVIGEDQLDQIRAMIRPACVLMALLAVTAISLTGLQRVTDLATAQTATANRKAILSQVMPGAAFSSETPYRTSGALSILACYSTDDQLMGYSVEVQSQGFRGPVTMQVGVDLDGQVTGVAVTNHNETPGVGTRAMTADAMKTYLGRSGTLRTTGINAVDTVAGATATSHAITAGVNRALAIVANLDTEGGDITYVDGEV